MKIDAHPQCRTGDIGIQKGWEKPLMRRIEGRGLTVRGRDR